MGVGRITVRELQELLAGISQPAVLDGRAPHLYAAGHIPGARPSPTGRYGYQPLAGVPEDRLVVTYCDMRQRAKASGEYRSERVAGKAAALGYRVLVLEGGFPAWKKAGLAVETGSA